MASRRYSVEVSYKFNGKFYMTSRYYNVSRVFTPRDNSKSLKMFGKVFEKILFHTLFVPVLKHACEEKWFLYYISNQ